MIVAMLIKPLLPFFLGISNLMLGIVEVNSKLSPINLFSFTTGSGNLFILSSKVFSCAEKMFGEKPYA